MPQIAIGVDVAKNWIDVAEPSRKPRRIAMEPAALRRFARTAAKAGALVRVRGERRLRSAACCGARGGGVPYARVNPRQARALRPRLRHRRQDRPCRCSHRSPNWAPA